METEIREAASKHVGDLAHSMGMPVYWLNVPVPDDPEDEHIRGSVLPITPDIHKTNGRGRFAWILQMSIYVRDGTGDPGEYVDALRRGFPFNTELTNGGHTFRTTDRGYAPPPVQTDGWLFIPMQFRLQTFN